MSATDAEVVAAARAVHRLDACSQSTGGAIADLERVIASRLRPAGPLTPYGEVVAQARALVAYADAGGQVVGDQLVAKLARAIATTKEIPRWVDVELIGEEGAGQLHAEAHLRAAVWSLDRAAEDVPGLPALVLRALGQTVEGLADFLLAAPLPPAVAG